MIWKNIIFWDKTPCNPLKVKQVNQLEGRKQAVLASYFHAGDLFGLFFNPEDGGGMFLRNVGWISRD
jgi:hypothetical protein